MADKLKPESYLEELNPVALLEEARRMYRLINSPMTEDFLQAVQLESAHQVYRWGTSHDRGKSAFDWFWLIGYLSQKAAQNHHDGNAIKALHHTISTAAALLNWHQAISGENNEMMPGIDIEEPK